MPVNMMPEAARERTVSFRPRAPHSLRFREYPRPKASFTERDSTAAFVTGMGTNVKVSVAAAVTQGAFGMIVAATKLHSDRFKEATSGI